MKKKIKLEISRRTVAKKKVDRLRAQDIIPGIVYGRGFDPVPVQVRSKDFEAVYKQIHGTAMFDLYLDGMPHKALIHALQRDKLSHKVRHIDFLRVNLKERVSVEVPLVMTGHSPLEETGIGIVSQQTMSLHVKCLPEEIPNEIAVDRALIKAKEGVIHAGDIPLPTGVTLANEAEKERILAAFMVARVHETPKEEAAKEEEVVPAE